MNTVIHTFKIALGILLVGAVLYAVVAFYPYIFSKSVDGVLVSVEKVQLNVALMQSEGSTLSPQLFSFAVAIRTDDGEIFTASAEDRQWAAAMQGRCVTAEFYPYPPWKLAKGGTFFNARLDRQYECPERAKKALQAEDTVRAILEQVRPAAPSTETPQPAEEDPQGI